MSGEEPRQNPAGNPARVDSYLEPRLFLSGVVGAEKEERDPIATGSLTPLVKTGFLLSVRPVTAASVDRPGEQHNQAVCRSGKLRRVLPPSRVPGARRRAPFAPHDVRRRGLRLMVNQTVLCLTVWLARWRCRNCGLRVYRLPRLSYSPINATPVPRCSILPPAIVENDRQSYRETASPGGRRRVYQTSARHAGHRRTGLLDHSTVWRMLTWLGCQLAALTEAAKRIQQHIPRPPAIASWGPSRRTSSAARNVSSSFANRVNCFI